MAKKLSRTVLTLCLAIHMIRAGAVFSRPRNPGAVLSNPAAIARAGSVDFAVSNGTAKASGAVLRNPARTDRVGAVDFTVSNGTVNKKIGDDCHHDTVVALANYRAGKSDLWFYHITHHAGTTIFGLAQKNGLQEAQSDKHGEFVPTHDPNIFHMWGETLHGPGGKLPADPLNDHVPCSSNQFVSMIIWRHPLSRILAGDGSWTTTPKEHVDKCNTDNYGLRWLIGKPTQEQLTESDLVFAEQRLDMFDIVLITEDITDTSKMLCRDLGWKDCSILQKEHTNPVDRLPQDVYQRWADRNAYEMKLYRHAVERSKEMMASHARGPLATENINVLTETPKRVSSFEVMDNEEEMHWVCA